ncbi:MAG TPA: transposase [Ktedonobacterales bacterium]|nr:transposase [Ktedonobacterales bacterium]
MSKPLVSDELWSIIAPHLPSEPPKPKGGRRRRIGDRAALTGILFVLKSGIRGRCCRRSWAGAAQRG